MGRCPGPLWQPAPKVSQCWLGLLGSRCDASRDETCHLACCALQGNTGKGRDRGAVALQQVYLRVVGLEEELQGSHALPTFTCAHCMPALARHATAAAAGLPPARPPACRALSTLAWRVCLRAPGMCVLPAAVALGSGLQAGGARGAGLPCRAEEEADFKEYAARPDVFSDIAGRIAPQIFGHREIKQAVACLLFGGARKVGPS